ncbi:MAG: cation transporter [candidate division KSB1 bacterium]|nr:cation transporter [candidate division KSB1 bacterium]MDZ7399584.1 cation transporter [candidate division KSB1 bacterium]
MKIKNHLFLILFFAFIVLLNFDCKKSSHQKEKIQLEIAEVTIPVQGMTCGSCEHHIETEVIRKAGVIEIKADHQKAIAHVKYDSSKISLDQLVAAINETGYKASMPVASDQ